MANVFIEKNEGKPAQSRSVRSDTGEKIEKEGGFLPTGGVGKSSGRNRNSAKRDSPSVQTIEIVK